MGVIYRELRDLGISKVQVFAREFGLVEGSKTGAKVKKF